MEIVVALYHNCDSTQKDPRYSGVKSFAAQHEIWRSFGQLCNPILPFYTQRWWAGNIVYPHLPS